jgi:hypothetical protein
MRFEVPQFIEVEDKIFGPLTFKQFVYLGGGAGIAYAVYALLSGFLPLFILIIPIIAILAFSAALAFYQINNKPFIVILESALRYAVGNKLYIWKKENKKAAPKAVMGEDAAVAAGMMVPKLSESKLKDLGWSLDVKDSIYSNYQDNKPR